MSMMNLSISTFRPYHSPRWSQLKHDWQRYARSRQDAWQRKRASMIHGRCHTADNTLSLEFDATQGVRAESSPQRAIGRLHHHHVARVSRSYRCDEPS
jgi:hypothetical protein